MNAARPPLFVDSSSWIAVNNPRDRHHESASDFYRDKAFRRFNGLVTTNLVIAETHAYLLKSSGRGPALKFLALVNSGARIKVIHSKPELEEEALRILFKYQDQELSFCDAVSFAVMKDQGIKDAFALDTHFETAGFHRLPK
ncbi:MAG: type II toxin-antitoxin system VapC family toxin [Thermoleophilia bacterium]